jgi:hypothetical protein
MQNLGKSILHSRSSAQAEQQPKDLPLDNQHGFFFFFQFCDVAKLAIIHKKTESNLAIDQI